MTEIIIGTFLMFYKIMLKFSKKDEYFWSLKPSHNCFYYCLLKAASNFLILKNLTYLVIKKPF